MTEIAPSTLIVGTDSLIGGALMAHLEAAGDRPIGTTRRPEELDDSHILLDLENAQDWRPPRPVEVAIICAGVTKLDACERDPASTSRINVQSVAELTENLVEQGGFVIYVSSSAVFDGLNPDPQPESLPSPITEYGRQKAQAEKSVSKWGDSAAVVRLTKVLGPATPPFSDWSESLKQGKAIHPYSDLYFAPVPLFYAVMVLCLVGRRRLAGTLQVSGTSEFSYAEAASLGADLLDADPLLVQPMQAPQPNQDQKCGGPHSAMNVDRLKSTLGIEPPDVRWTLEMAFTNPRALGRPHSVD